MSSAPLAAPRTDRQAVPELAGYTGPVRDFAPRLHLMVFNRDEFREIADADPEDFNPPALAHAVTWVDLRGIHTARWVRELAGRFGLHPLTVEDILNPDQRTKVEPYDDYTFVVMKVASAQPSGDTAVPLEHLSLVFGPGLVLTFQSTEADGFEPLRARLRQGGQLRSRGSDYLAYSLMDAIVDDYLRVVERLGQTIEDLEDEFEDETTQTQDRHLPSRLNRLRRELRTLRRIVAPTKDAVDALGRAGRLHKSTKPYLRDLHDHSMQLLESIDLYRDVVSSLIDLHQSRLSQRTNEEMRVLTRIATIFIPLTFLVGVYGMNFEHMPELHWPYAYPAMWGVMLLIAGTLGLYFWRRRWL